ncbi:MAG: hypothetical protein QM743_04705 [Chitinophagaceae bacterium]
MALVNSNRVNAVLDEGNLITIKSLFQQIAALMPMLVGLTAEERQRLPKINVSNKAFTEDAFRILRNNASFFPGFLNPTFMSYDLTLFQQLDELATISRQLTERITDTMTLAGNEAYVSALSVYRLSEAAALAGMPGADEARRQLSMRFSGQGSSAENNSINEDATSNPVK